MPAEPVLQVRDLTKTYGSGDDAVTAVDDVSFGVESGSVVGLLGPNGAGKTTTIKSVLGLVTPEEGRVQVAGIDVHRCPRAAGDRVGAILEGARNTYWRLTVRENLSFFAGLGGADPADVRDRQDRLLELLGLEHRADSPVNDLSRGMKQKVSVASTLARDVDVVFLDEPTLGLDVEASRAVRSELRRMADSEGVAVVLTSHDMDVVEAVCDRVVVLKGGSIVADEDLDALLDLFEMKKYRLDVERNLGETAKREVRRSFDVEIVETDDALELELAVQDVGTVYRLLDLLDGADAAVDELRSVDPGFEDVFLRLAGGSDRAGPADRRAGDDGGRVGGDRP